jgi:anti-sigma factor RsiW
MTRHLSSVEISEWVAGARSRRSEDHLHECAECRGELARLQETLSDFRASVREWSAQGAAAPILKVRDRTSAASVVPGFKELHRAYFPPRLRWALIAAAIVLLAVIPIYRANRLQPTPDSSLDDAVLLEQIDEGVSRSVPAPMEPLTTLVSEGSTAAVNRTQQKK